MSNLKVNIAGVEFKNPIITASGTFGFGKEYGEFYPLSALGGICTKGLTLKKREGNPPPRVAETYGGMLNSVGLQNPGIEHYLAEDDKRLAKEDVVVIANIAGSTLEDYIAIGERINDSHADMVELNISCPNVHDGGMTFGTSPKAAAEVTAAVKAVTTKPVFVKLSPNVTDIVEIAKACEKAGADGLTLVNTFLGMRIDIRRRRPVVAAGMGGFSGKAIFPIALRMVWQVAHACRIPVMGCGGVSSAEDVVEMMMAGASAVQVGAENIRNPWACPEIIAALPALMDNLSVSSLKELIGAV